MINALSASSLADFSIRLKRNIQAAHGQRPAPMAGLDQLHLSNRSKQVAAAGGPTAPSRPAISQPVLVYESVQTAGNTPATLAGQPGFEAQLRNAFFTSETDAGFNAALDLDSDGRIDFADLAAFRSGITVPAGPVAAPNPAPGSEPAAGIDSAFDRLRASMFSDRNSNGFAEQADLNGDGRVNFADLAALRQRADAAAQPPVEPVDEPVDEPAVGTDSALDRLRASMFADRSANGFSEHADLNGDGRINFADLAALRQRVDAAAQPPVDPADEPVDEPAVGTDSALDRLRASMFANRNANDFSEHADLNGDGRVNFADLAALRQRADAAAQPPVDAPANGNAPADRLRSSMFAASGSDRYDAGSDLNGDGRVDFADLAALRVKQDGAPARPVRPADPDDNGHG